MKVEYHPAVQGELIQIRDYYEERSPGLGAAFVDEFERQVLRVARNRSDGWWSQAIFAGV